MKNTNILLVFSLTFNLMYASDQSVEAKEKLSILSQTYQAWQLLQGIIVTEPVAAQKSDNEFYLRKLAWTALHSVEDNPADKFAMQKYENKETGRFYCNKFGKFISCGLCLNCGCCFDMGRSDAMETDSMIRDRFEEIVAKEGKLGRPIKYDIKTLQLTGIDEIER